MTVAGDKRQARVLRDRRVGSYSSSSNSQNKRRDGLATTRNRATAIRSGCGVYRHTLHGCLIRTSL